MFIAHCFTRDSGAPEERNPGAAEPQHLAPNGARNKWKALFYKHLAPPEQ
jgi:hypothetical protein